jgi:predicted esterase
MSRTWSREELVELAAAAFAEDLLDDLPAAAATWSLEDATRYFESGGEFRPSTCFVVVHRPHVAVRATNSLTGNLKRVLHTGDKIRGVPCSSDADWLQLSDSEFVMITHPKHGALLREDHGVAVDVSEAAGAPPPAAAPPPAVTESSAFKKQFETTAVRKACGANMKAVDAAGASRDALFDHFVRQEILVDMRKEFRETGIREDLYNTDLATDQECVIWCQMGGQLAPLPCKDGARKSPVGGVRQRVEWLGGLRCIVAEADEGSDAGAPEVLVLLAHGIHVLGDDLYGLAYNLLQTASWGGGGGGDRRRVRFVLPEGPEEVPLDPSRRVGNPADMVEEALRAPRRWFPWGAGDTSESVATNLAVASAQVAACSRAALEKAPGARLVLGGFSQGSAVALHVALSADAKPAAVIALSPQAPPSPLPAASLKGVPLLVASGTADAVAPIAMGEALLAACTDASVGAIGEPLLRYDGAHEVTPEVADAIAAFVGRVLAL